MADKMIENNQVVIMGEIVSPFTFSHQVFGEGFYLVDVMVKRLSESQDIIPVMVSERPFFGVGPGRIKELYPLYRQPGFVEPAVGHLHDNAIHVAAETGVPSALAYLALVVARFRMGLRGREAAAFAALGFAFLLFVVVGVGAIA